MKGLNDCFDRKMFLLVLFIGLLVVSGGVVFGQGVVTLDDLDPDRDDSGFPSTLEKFFSLSSASQKSLIERYPSRFANLIQKEGGKEGLAELWFKVDDKKDSVLSDETKNIIWESYDADKREKVLIELVDKKFREKYGDVLKDVNKVGVKDRIKILDEKGELKWFGNKLGVVNKDGELVSWLDLDKLPRWINDITFENGKFNIGFDTGNGIVNVIFSGGTIGETYGELIGPNGKRIGTRMDEGLKSMKYDNDEKQFVVEYEFMGRVSTFNLKVEDLPPEIRKKVQGILEGGGPVGERVNEILSKLDGMGVDFLKGIEEGLPTQNMLSVLYGGDKNNPGIVEVNYNGNGDPEIKLSNGADLVTIDSKGEVERHYKQWYSKGGVKNAGSENYVEGYNAKHPDSPIVDEAGVFVFGSNGEIEAAQNAQIRVPGLGTASVSRVELTGVDIVRNSFVDAIMRGDKKAVIEAVFKRGADILTDDLGLSWSLKDLRREGYNLKDIDSNLPAIEKKLLNILNEELENPDLSIEIKSQISETINSISSNLEARSKNLLDYIMKGDVLLDESEIQIRNELIRSGAGELNNAVYDLLSNPDELVNLGKFKVGGEFYGDKEQANKFIREFLRARVDSELAKGFVEGVNQEVTDAILDLGLEVNSPEIDFDKIKSDINKKIDGLDFFTLLNEGSGDTQSWDDTLRRDLKKINVGGVQVEISEDSANAIVTLITEAKNKVIQEAEGFMEDVKRDFFESGSSKYDNQILMDTYLNEVYVRSDKVVIFDADSPLDEFRAESTRKSSGDKADVIYLKSKGQLVASFDGGETKTVRRNYNAGVSIDRIINVNSGSELKFDKSNSYSYSVYDPKRLVMKSNNLLSIGWLRAHPLLQTVVQGPLEGDIAGNPDSKVTIVLGGYRPTLLTRLGFRFGGSRIRSKAGQGAAAAKMQLGLAIESIKRTTGYQQFTEGGSWLFNQIESTGAQVPQVIGDSYYVGAHPEELTQLMGFFESKSSSLGLGTRIDFTGSYISMGGSKLELSPEFHRTLLRAVANNPIRRHLRFRDAFALRKGVGSVDSAIDNFL